MSYKRLPKNIIPINYDLELFPNLKALNFVGKVFIDIQVSFKIY